MTYLNFVNSFNSIKVLLVNLRLYRQSGVKRTYIDGVSKEFKSASLSEDYNHAYSTAIKNFDYDFLLFDESFFQFSIDYDNDPIVPNVRYAYFQNPKQHRSYYSFLDMLREQNFIGEETNDELGDVFEDEYEQYLVEQQINQAATTIRFDMDVNNYHPMIHSTAHFHLGHNNMIRIPCDKFISPSSFVLFVIKHVYYYEWKALIEDKGNVIHTYISKAKTTCADLPSTFWDTKREGKELLMCE